MTVAEKSMKKWHRHYTERLCSAAEAIRLVESGNRVVLSHACGEPRILPEELARRGAELTDVKIFHMVSMGDAPYCHPDYARSFTHVACFAGKPTREAIWDSRADYIPCHFSEVPLLFHTHYPVDVAMVTVSPPGDDGCCSLGISVDYTKRAVDSARLVLAEVNEAMPRTRGDSLISVEAIDRFVEVDQPLYELPPARLDAAEQKIAGHVAELIDDGACLQLGIGGIPDALLSHLDGFSNLGIHSEMISDGAKRLIEKGVVTGSEKTLHRGKAVVTFLMGTKDLYRWVHDNPAIEMRTVDYTNNPAVIAQNKNMISINSALEVDLLGQVCADTLGPKQFSGVGGQLDFVRGARMSEGGKAIIALPSLTSGGASRIVPRLKDGAAVTTSRNDVDYVVTEHGIASLRGKTVRQRMKALLAITHPDYRDELSRSARELYHLSL